MNKQLTLIAKMVGITITALTAGQSFGAAFQTNYQSIPVASMAWAGRATNINDASAIATNPAGLSYLDSNSVTLGFEVVHPGSSITDANANVTTPTGKVVPLNGTTDGDMGRTSFIPSAYIALPSKLRSLSAGLGIYASYGFNAQYEDTFKGILFADQTKVKVATYQPTISYKYNDKLSVGAGLTINRAHGILSSSTGTPALPATLTNAIYQSRLDAEDTGYGANLGIMYRFNPQARIGLTYKSRVKYDLSGDATATLPLSATRSYGASGSGNLSLKTPDVVDLSGTYEVNPRLGVSGTVSWTGWSVLKTIQTTTDMTGPTAAITSALQKPAAENIGYKDTWLFALGADYKINPKFVARGGYAHDTSPVDTNTSIRMPSSDRNIFTIGLGYKPTDRISLDAMYGYVHEAEADANVTKTISTGIANYAGTFKNHYNLYGLQMNYKF